MTISRRHFLKLGLFGVGTFSATSVGGVAYSTRIEPYQISITRIEIPLVRLPAAFDGFTIAHISDLHLEKWFTDDYIYDAMDQVTALDADIIAMTGDYVSSRKPDEKTVSILSRLKAKEGVFATLGNHDHWVYVTAVTDALQSAGAKMVLNDYVVLKRGDESLFIAGVDDIWERQHDLNRALDGVREDQCVVLLAHEPDYADEVALDGRVSLQLSGHSHGGQVRLPLKGALMLPTLGKKYDMGLYDVQGLKLYVTRGLGMVQPFMRFNCPPEIVHITLRKG